MSYIGELAALGTALFWALSATSFSTASKRIGSLAVNIIRLVMAFGVLTIVNGIFRGWWLPFDAPARNWLILSLSGIVGFTLGDLFLFEAFTLIGARVSLLIMASSPIMTSFLAFLLMGEALSPWALLGVFLAAGGISLVVLKPGQGRLVLAHPAKGILFAFGGSLGQAGGLLLSKVGMRLPNGGEYPAIAAAQLRELAGIAGFALIYLAIRAWPKVFRGMRDRRAMAFSALGALAGPVIGVSLSLVAVSQARAAGIASSLMSLSPVIMVPVSIFFLKEKVRLVEILGAIVAVLGAACTFL